METARWRDVVRRDLFGPRPDPRDRLYRLVIRLVLVVFRLLDLRFDVRGGEHVPASGPAVVCSNHVSYLDFTFLGLAALPRRRLVRFMAKESVFRHRVSGPLMRAMRHIPVDRRAGAAAFDAAVRALKDGQVVGVFPEATISSSFVLKDLKAGAARMAIDSGAPVLPAAVWGGHRITTKHHPVDLRRGVAVTVVLGEPIVPEPGETAPALLGRIRAAMEVLVDEAQRTYPQPPSGPAELWWQPAHLGGTAPTPQQAAERDHPDVRGTRRRLPRPHPVARLRRLVGRRGRR
ncbi:lysophospholipid acyltransferase family protein [Geodermatophilus marinus]|uniref:lysophospholipid acyltransferase family protein n=1 Tax=Geodermatophilus sp. LHW52908 TaxID=2303986 RepID=UPI000E3B5EB2|nr:lysophospholipid acyltransferase family protein [Geodermatophilus sp. LHW52908]RFU20759.1 1-acyl-sn-glycerol-3-phosphate acyltransferase [Geodermatophilus sp. LHW52908]